jgi:hypothetical protein
MLWNSDRLKPFGAGSHKIASIGSITGCEITGTKHKKDFPVYRTGSI